MVIAHHMIIKILCYFDWRQYAVQIVEYENKRRKSFYLEFRHSTTEYDIWLGEKG